MTPQKIEGLMNRAKNGSFTKVVKGMYFTRSKRGRIITIHHLDDNDYIDTPVYKLWRVDDEYGDPVDVSTYSQAKEVAKNWTR